MKYELLYEYSVAGLNEIVQAKLDKGWKPYGSPSRDEGVWIQAVTFTDFGFGEDLDTEE